MIWKLWLCCKKIRKRKTKTIKKYSLAKNISRWNWGKKWKSYMRAKSKAKFSLKTWKKCMQAQWTKTKSYYKKLKGLTTNPLSKDIFFPNAFQLNKITMLTVSSATSKSGKRKKTVPGWKTICNALKMWKWTLNWKTGIASRKYWTSMILTNVQTNMKKWKEDLQQEDPKIQEAQ